MWKKSDGEKKPLRRFLLVCVLFAANLVVINVVYSVWKAERGTPFLESVKTCALCELVRAKLNAAERGTVTGIVHDAEDTFAIINNNKVNEGAIIDGVKVVRIDPTEVEFSKEGKIWHQVVGQEPDSAWK